MSAAEQLPPDAGGVDQPAPAAHEAAFPLADIAAGGASQRLVRQAASRLWWLTLLCLLVAVVLVVASQRRPGAAIAVRFQQGHGLKPGDRLRYRGIDVGEVTAIEMDANLGGVLVQVQLQPEATSLARDGSRFWIERPRFSLSGVTGIDTVVGAKYLAVLPGPLDAPTRKSFVGEESPLTVFDPNVLTIEIQFAEGNGLTVGDDLRHRGIVVGEVADVALRPGLDGVTVRVRVLESASRLARAGSQFWIERPAVSLTQIRGLETLVGGRYLAVVPGPDDADPQTRFVGLDEPPAIRERIDGAMEIVLQGGQRHSVEAGEPVTFRGLTVGRVLAVGLAPDAAHVEIRVAIDPSYKMLVRDNSRFWSTGGIELNVGLGGLHLSSETLATIANGGVAFATPSPPGKSVSTGHRFPFVRRPEDDWLTWKPMIAVGGANLPDGITLPGLTRVAVHWQEKQFGFTRQRSRQGWMLPLADGRIVGPSSLFAAPTQAVPDSMVLEIEGQQQTVAMIRAGADSPGAAAWAEQPLTFLALPELVPPERRWPVDRLRTMETLEPELFLLTDSFETRIPIPDQSLTKTGDAWRIDPSLTIPAESAGASLVSPRDGRLLGMLVLERGEGRIEPVRP